MPAPAGTLKNGPLDVLGYPNQNEGLPWDIVGHISRRRDVGDVFDAR